MNPFIQTRQTTPLCLIVILLACFALPHMAQSAGSFAAVLAGHRWQVRSKALACQGLKAFFEIDGTFDGTLQNPPDDMFIRPQRVRGEWRVDSPLLVLSYNYTSNLPGGQVLPCSTRFIIQITEVSQRRLAGVHKVHMVYPFGGGEADEIRLWEFERLD